MAFSIVSKLRWTSPNTGENWKNPPFILDIVTPQKKRAEVTLPAFLYLIKA
jgi:hypothetical protein